MPTRQVWENGVTWCITSEQWSNIWRIQVHTIKGHAIQDSTHDSLFCIQNKQRTDKSITGSLINLLRDFPTIVTCPNTYLSYFWGFWRKPRTYKIQFRTQYPEFRLPLWEENDFDQLEGVQALHICNVICTFFFNNMYINFGLHTFELAFSSGGGGDSGGVKPKWDIFQVRPHLKMTFQNIQGAPGSFCSHLCIDRNSNLLY